MSLFAVVLLLCLAVGMGSSFAPFPASPGDTGFSPEFGAVVNSICGAKWGSDSAQRDACFGCIMRHDKVSHCKDSRKQLAACSRIHLQDTPYSECLHILEVVKDEGNGTRICDFEVCVRHKEKETLVEECVKEMLLEENPVSNYIRTTACILARLRCREDMAAQQPWGLGPGPVTALFVTEHMQLESGKLYGAMQGEVRCGEGKNHERQAMWETCKCSE